MAKEEGVAQAAVRGTVWVEKGEEGEELLRVDEGGAGCAQGRLKGSEGQAPRGTARPLLLLRS